MVFPCGRGVEVGICVGISMGISVGFIATGVEVIVGVHATNNKMPKSIVKK
jgi:hypothetical protein